MTQWQGAARDPRSLCCDGRVRIYPCSNREAEDIKDTPSPMWLGLFLFFPRHGGMMLGNGGSSLDCGVSLWAFLNF